MAVLRGPDEMQMTAIRTELGETEEQFEENMKIMKNWMKNQSHIPNDCDENLIRLFLRGCKHKIPLAQKKISEFFAVRKDCTVLFGDWDLNDSGTIAAMNYMLHAPMPQLTEDGYRVVFHKVTVNDNVSLKDVVRLLLMFADLRMEEEHAIAGDIYVFDVKDLKIPFLMKFITPLTKKILEIIQYAYPQRLKQIHVINAPTVVYSTVKFIKSFMKEKMRNRVIFVIHTSDVTIHDYISGSVLPSDYEGEALSIHEINSVWVDKLKASREKLREKSANSRFAKKKSLQIMKVSPYSQNMYETEGMFRSLSID